MTEQHSNQGKTLAELIAECSALLATVPQEFDAIPDWVEHFEQLANAIVAAEPDLFDSPTALPQLADRAEDILLSAKKNHEPLWACWTSLFYGAMMRLRKRAGGNPLWHDHE